MLGAAANVIMQLGLPPVGYGVVESRVDSGNVMLHPWKRLRTTISYLVVALFGTASDRAAMRTAVNGAHRQVRSGATSPVAYNAFDPVLQLWVAACLYVGFRDARELCLGPLSDAEADALYEHCRRLGTTLQVTDDMWPRDRAAFSAYWSETLAQVRYDAAVRDHLLAVVDLAMIPAPLRFINARINRWGTIGFLPREFRDAMDLAWSPRDQRRFDRLMRLVRLTNRLTPRWTRVLPVTLLLAEVRLRVKRGWSIV